MQDPYALTGDSLFRFPYHGALSIPDLNGGLSAQFG